MTITPERLSKLAAEATASAAAAQDALHRRNDAVAQAAREGMIQKDIVESVGLTREQVRRIVRRTAESE